MQFPTVSVTPTSRRTSGLGFLARRGSKKLAGVSAISWSFWMVLLTPSQEMRPSQRAVSPALNATPPAPYTQAPCHPARSTLPAPVRGGCQSQPEAEWTQAVSPHAARRCSRVQGFQSHFRPSLASDLTSPCLSFHTPKTDTTFSASWSLGGGRSEKQCLRSPW